MGPVETQRETELRRTLSGCVEDSLACPGQDIALGSTEKPGGEKGPRLNRGPRNSLSQQAQLPSLGDGFGFVVETSLRLNKHHGASPAASRSSRSISSALHWILSQLHP